MKKVLKSGTKIVSVFLAALFVVQILPMSVFAEDFTQGGAEAVQGAESVGVQSQQSEGQAIVLAEDTSKREEYVKHFRMSDGSVKAVEYDVPVHFEQNGEWTDYDNTLTETDAEADENEGKLAKNKDLVNQSADYSVRLSKKTNGKKFVRLEKDGCKISWYYLNAEKVEASVADAADDGDETTLEKVSSVVRYSGVYKSTDFEYILGSQGLKENIILLDAKAPREFTAEYKTQGLTPVSLDDKTVELRNAAGETVYVISAPYMVDANGESAWGITLSIISVKNDTFQLKLSLDSAWLDSADRAYPVTADPYLQTEQGWNELTNCHSAYIASATPNARYGRGGSNYEGSLYVGKTNGRGVTRSLIKTSNLPALGVADKVIHAEYAFYVNACYPEMRMDMHRITSAWEQSTVCWNSNVTYDNKIIDYQIVQYMETSNTTAERWQRFELTDLVRGWYSGEIPNNGVLLRSDYETSSSQKRVWMLSSGYTTYSGVRPLLIIHYRNMSGYEDYWSYTSVSAGRNGVASVNNYNGNLIFSQPVTQDDGGNLMPVALSVIYNQNANNAPYTQVGYNVQTNYHLYVRPESAAVSERGYKYYFNDADGTHHSFYFENGNTTHGTDEDGLGYSLDVVQGGYCITDKSGTTMNFNSAGNLTMITNASGVSSTVEYETAEEILRIKNIKDGAGRAYTFYYEAQYPGLCAKIVAPSGKETRFGYDFGCLRWITFADEKICELIYDSSRYVMTGIKSIDAMLVNFVTDSTNQKRVTQISCGTSETVLSEKYTLDYKQNATSVTDIKQRTYTYQFNDFAQTTGTVSSADGSAQFFKLGASGSGNMTNKLLSESRVLRSAENFIVNPGFTHADYTGYGTYTEPASGTSVSIDSSKKNFTANSLKIYKASSASGSVLSLQDVTSAPVGTYTLSAYINTNNATLAGDGAHLGVELRNSSGVIEEIAYIEKTVKTNGWERRCVTFTLQQGYSLRVVAGFSGASSGSVWFDDLQLERGAGESSFNLVENPAFTNGVNNWVSEPGVAPTLASSGNLTGYSYCGKIPGTVEGGNKNLIQSIPVSGSAGDVFAFGMWTKAFSAPVKNGTKNVDAYQPSYEIALHYYGTNGVWAGYAHLDCNADLRDTWQFTTEELIIPIAYSRIAIEIIYNYNVNDAYMTGAFCYKEQYGQTYTYDADGNAVSVADLAKTESEFAYYGNQMTKLLNPTGSKYFYTYNNSNKQLNYALSTDGQEYGFTYDNKGNATKAEISAREPAAALETGKEYIIVNAFSGQALDSFWAGNPGDKTTTYLYVPTESEQHWRLEAVAGEPDVYRIRSMLAGSSNMYLDVEGSSGENGAMFQIYTGNNSVAQKFKIIKKQDNSFVILSACSNYTKCADAQYEQGSKIVLSQKVRQNTYDATNPAGRVCWYFIPVEKTEAKTIVTEATYTDNQNFLSTLKDQRGNTTSYTYDQIRGTLTSVTDARGKITSYTYDKKINVITGVSSGSMAVSYAYENDRLKTINVNDSVKYSFGYDGFGRTTSTKVGNGSSWRSLSAVQYNTQGLVLKQTYGNGSYVSYAYDSFDRPVSKKYNGSTQGISYGYNNLGWLSSVNDSVNDTRTSYTYDLAGRVAGSDTVQGTAGGYMRTYSRYVYEDKTNRLSEYNVRMPKSGTTTQTRLQPFEFVYGTGADIDRVTYVKLMNQEVLGYSYDGFGRLVTRSYESTSGSTARSTAYTYLDGAGTGRTSTLVGTVNNSGLGVLGYSYDAVGNITGITKDGAAYESYTYDDLNQLSSVTRSGVTTNYAYTNGNISSVTRAGVAVKTYTYGNTVWKDLLTAYNGTAITYDTIGNPLSYRGMSMTWQNGRQLAGITKTGYNISYTYGADGERISKSVNGVTTRFYTTNGQTVGFNTSDGKDFAYIFDGSGAVCGLTYENYAANAAAQNYYFAFNAQGDVIGIYSSSGAVVAKYEYDEWGKPTAITDGAGTDVSANSSHIANLNPFRYRGYYYDSETGLYSLQSRYYDPEIGRFLNADSVISGSGTSVQGYNLFAYCMNNPVNMSDESGRWPQWVKNAASWVNNNIIKPVANFFSPSTNTISGKFQDGIFRGSGSLTGGYSEFNGRLQVNSKDNKNNGMLGGYAKVSGGNASGKVGIGNDNVSLSLKGVGDTLTATAQAGIQYKDGFGVAAKAKASVLSGRATTEFELFGWQIEFGVSGDVLSVGAEAMIGIFPDEGFTAKASVGAGLFGGGFVFRVKPNQ